VPSREQLSSVQHHFIQICSLEDPYNASRFEMEVLDLLETLFQKHTTVIMVGGSGLYIDAVCEGIDDLPPVDKNVRERLHQRLETEGLEALTELLKELDPESHERIDLKNHMRVLKALEVSIQTGKPYSGFLSSTPKKRPFRILRLALDMQRELLYERINSRVDRMMEQGLLEEVNSLTRFRGLTPMKTVGYRELFRYLDGEMSLEAAVDLVKRNTRKFARKQLTWFRKEDRYTWFNPEQTDQIDEWMRRNLHAATGNF
jgi:tRNA dimethylallyltransferase